MPPPSIQDNIGYTPIREKAGPSNTGLLQVPIIDASIATKRRHLVGRFLNNDNTYVSMIRLEPGPGSRFKVIIMLEISNAL